MRMLTLNECGLVTGGLMPRAGGAATAQRIRPPKRRHTPDAGGGVRSGYYYGGSGTIGSDYGGYGYLGGITPQSGMGGFVDFGPQYANTSVNTSDTVTTGTYNSSTQSAPATLWNDGTQIAKGLFQVAAGTAGIAFTMQFDLDTAGLWQMVGGSLTVGASIQSIVAGEQNIVGGAINLVHHLDAPAPSSSSDFYHGSGAVDTEIA